MFLCKGCRQSQSALACHRRREVIDEGQKYDSWRTITIGKGGKNQTVVEVKKHGQLDTETYNKLVDMLGKLGWSFKYSKKDEEAVTMLNKNSDPYAQLVLLGAPSANLVLTRGVGAPIRELYPRGAPDMPGPDLSGYSFLGTLTPVVPTDLWLGVRGSQAIAGKSPISLGGFPVMA